MDSFKRKLKTFVVVFVIILGTVKRKLFIWMLLAVFTTATTGFTVQQCCCDKNPEKTCCSKPESKGCKDDITYYKLKSDLQIVKAETSFATLYHVVLFAFADFHQAVLERFVSVDNSDPPLIELASLSRLQVFRI